MRTDDDRVLSQWHPGEETMHRLMQVPYEDNPTAPGLPTAYGLWMTRSPLVALGTIGVDDRVWTTLLGGAAGTATPAAVGVLRLRFQAQLEPHTAEQDTDWSGTDPVLEGLLCGDNTNGRGRLVSGLVIDLEHRGRAKIAGRMLDGVVVEKRTKTTPSEKSERVDVQVDVTVDGTLGNCPKYLNKRAITPYESSPQLITDSLPLPAEALAIIGKSDTFLISSRHGTDSMDTNIRGGSPGFVRVFSNSEAEGVTLVYPEYSGNRLYQTLGNITSDRAVGVTFPDFDTGDVLYLAGRAEVLIDDAAEHVLPHSNLAVRIEIEAVRLVRNSLPFRGTLLEPSPYNPPVRRSAREVGVAGQQPRPADRTLASLIHKLPITPTISRYTFRLSPGEPPKPLHWCAGQHVTLDFAAQLDRGWSHMRDHDPSSLNDDFIRTFTVSSEPDALGSNEFEITVREHGPVTGLLSRWTPRSDLDVTVMGFGGEDDTRYADTKPDTDDVVVVASGVGITPFTAQARAAHESGLALTLLWSVRAEDLALAVDVIERVSHWGVAITVFLTGHMDSNGYAQLRTLEQLGARTHTRRMTEADVKAVGRVGRRQYYVCAARPLHKAVLEWVAGEDVRFEAFDY
ncbi:pyridoxamine 5'-phosphate oxidase family protein [Rhodococcus ruber]|uniref:Pyridoxamine 5'-phosphate oxidase family protein n=1 Tax=Rhodococcus ruber TaxID=1830 RepID=A0ABT4MHZ2_9NOCA|nr:pyridoxamine 5'-phosphate oxidase family protein [Rhodococcus ruber]MCZ4519346.1 pyridoxamine 5'-phosphate oxidase family protein [Rhodococcus ruber]